MSIDDTVKVQVHALVYGVRIQGAAQANPRLRNIYT